ncbi:MAG: hypothetical protein FJW39_02830 [Acidobacteria bacterium]|nr:hypothetical protein [Acidobacteriota bacterium]
MRTLFALLTLTAHAAAALVDMHVVERTDLAMGKSFSTAGPYEQIRAKAWFAVDPALPANRIITDLRYAPRNAEGRVEFSADVHVIKPRDPAKGNGTLLFEVSNRGGMGLMRLFNYGSNTDDGAGDGLLLNQGFTLAWAAWQFDVPEGGGKLTLRVPVARGVSGHVRSQDAITTRTASLGVADRGHVPYAASNTEDPAHQLYSRDYGAGPRTLVPRNRWRFTDSTNVTLEGGFLPGKIYEVVYTSQDPAVAGLGPAAIRDFVSFLKHGGGRPTTLLGDQRRFLKRAIAFGSSQSGRFLRTYLYQGFNGDEHGRIVFDGMMPHIAGAARGRFTHRFAQPSRGGTQLHSDLFPFRDLGDTDPRTGEYDALLRIASGTNTVPKIMYTNTSNEYWRSSSSLIHTSLDGSADAQLPPTTRIYLLSGCQHGAGSWPPAPNRDLVFRGNTNDYRPILRALILALNSWVASGKEPPPSRYPSVEAGQLSAPDRMAFPKIPGVSLPARIWQARRLDYGPDYTSLGIIALEPPKITGEPYGARLPSVDADGNETSGVRNPVVAVPMGTHLGWNLIARAAGPETEIANLTGGYIPFARTRRERERAGDSRLSIEERYRSREDYLARLTAYAQELVAGGYLLEQDVARIQQRGAAEWDHMIIQASR